MRGAVALFPEIAMVRILDPPHNAVAVLWC